MNYRTSFIQIQFVFLCFKVIFAPEIFIIMKHCFWLVFLIIISVSSSFSTEKEKRFSFSQAEQCKYQFFNDDIFLVSTVFTDCTEMPAYPTNINFRLWKKQNLQKKWSRDENGTSLYHERNIRLKYPDKPNKRYALMLLSRYKNGFYVYYLRKLLI